MAGERLTQAAAEVLRTGDPLVRMTQATVEVLRETPVYPKVRLTQAAAEVLRTGDPLVRMTQATVEVLREYGLGSAPQGAPLMMMLTCE